MTALSLPGFPWTTRTPKRIIDETVQTNDPEYRKMVGEMIAAGACDSEYGVQMLMSLFPDRF